MQNDLSKDGGEDSAEARRRANDARYARTPLWLIAGVAFVMEFASRAMAHETLADGVTVFGAIFTGTLISLGIWAAIVPLARWFMQVSWTTAARIVGAGSLGFLAGHAVYLLMLTP